MDEEELERMMREDGLLGDQAAQPSVEEMMAKDGLAPAPQQQTGTGEALIRGWMQGASSNLADDAVEFIEPAFGEEGQHKRFDVAAQEHPIATGVGNVAGALTQGLATRGWFGRGLGGSVKQGAAMGGASAIGDGESAAGVAERATFGAAGGMGGHVVGQALFGLPGWVLKKMSGGLKKGAEGFSAHSGRLRAQSSFDDISKEAKDLGDDIVTVKGKGANVALNHPLSPKIGEAKQLLKDAQAQLSYMRASGAHADDIATQQAAVQQAEDALSYVSRLRATTPATQGSDETMSSLGREKGALSLQRQAVGERLGPAKKNLRAAETRVSESGTAGALKRAQQTNAMISENLVGTAKNVAVKAIARGALSSPEKADLFATQLLRVARGSETLSRFMPILTAASGGAGAGIGSEADGEGTEAIDVVLRHLELLDTNPEYKAAVEEAAANQE